MLKWWVLCRKYIVNITEGHGQMLACPPSGVAKEGVDGRSVLANTCVSCCGVGKAFFLSVKAGNIFLNVGTERGNKFIVRTG